MFNDEVSLVENLVFLEYISLATQNILLHIFSMIKMLHRSIISGKLSWAIVWERRFAGESFPRWMKKQT